MGASASNVVQPTTCTSTTTILFRRAAHQFLQRTSACSVCATTSQNQITSNRSVLCLRLYPGDSCFCDLCLRGFRRFLQIHFIVLAGSGKIALGFADRGSDQVCERKGIVIVPVDLFRVGQGLVRLVGFEFGEGQ